MAADSKLSLTEFTHRVLVALAVIGVALLFWRWIHVFLLIFGAVLVAVILRALADPIGRYARVNERWSLFFSILIFVGLLGGSLWLFGSTVADQLAQLGQALPSAWEKVQPQVATLPFGPQILATIEGYNPVGPPGQDASPLTEGVISQLQGLVVKIGGIARSAVGAVAEIFIVIIAGAYLAVEPRVYRDGALMLLPERARPEVAQALNEAARALRLWLVGTVFSMLVVGVLTGLGAAALGLPAPVALGLIAGIAQFIPIVGPISSIVPGLLVALGMGTSTIIWTLVVYIGIQQFEANLLTPLVQRRTVKIPPAVTLFAVIATGLLFGPIGVALATPLAVTAFVMIRRLYVRDVIGEPIKPDVT